MYSDYLVNNRFYLKEDINIECAEYIETHNLHYVKYNGTWSNIHEWVIVKDYIDILDFVKNEGGFVFNYHGKTFIYWCDMSIFVKIRCKTKSEVRDENIDKLIQ